MSDNFGRRTMYTTDVRWHWLFFAPARKETRCPLSTFPLLENLVEIPMFRIVSMMDVFDHCFSYSTWSTLDLLETKFVQLVTDHSVNFQHQILESLALS